MELTNPDEVSSNELRESNKLRESNELCECKHENTTDCDRVLTCRDCGEKLENVISQKDQFSSTVVSRAN